MKQMSEEEIRRVQIQVLQEFRDFCEEHDITYSLCQGTLLGAIRHKGFVPWDDDIDVMMPRSDYERLLKLYKSNHYTLHHYSTCKPYIYSYAKMSDNRTVMKEGKVYDCELGVNIDIFPIDALPDTESEYRKWIKKLDFWKNISTIRNIAVSNTRSIGKNIVIALSRFITMPLPMKWLAKKIDTMSQQYDLTPKMVPKLWTGGGILVI